jgi:riboflavin synthase
MFTGIIEGTGTIASVQARADVLVVRVGTSLLGDMPRGGSIAVNGCCLTAIDASADGFVCELTPETVARTAFDRRLRPGVQVNLERPMRADGRFDGHIVQGHVDGLGCIRALRKAQDTAVLEVEPPQGLRRYLVEKGSVAIDGISLTVASLERDGFSVALIPYTLAVTNLRDARAGDLVCLEIDVIAKYVERLLLGQGRPPEA